MSCRIMSVFEFLDCGQLFDLLLGFGCWPRQTQGVGSRVSDGLFVPRAAAPKARTSFSGEGR